MSNIASDEGKEISSESASSNHGIEQPDPNIQENEKQLAISACRLSVCLSINPFVRELQESYAWLAGLQDTCILGGRDADKSKGVLVDCRSGEEEGVESARQKGKLYRGESFSFGSGKSLSYEVGHVRASIATKAARRR